MRKLPVLLAAYVAVGLGVVGFGWLITHPLSGPVDGFDDPISRWFAGERTGALDPVAEFGTLLGETPVGLGFAAVVGVVAGLVLRSFLPLLAMAVADVGHGGIYWAGTHADPRDRPPVKILDSELVPDHSFPSGHVGTAVAVYGGAALLLALWLRHRGTTGPAWAGVVVLGLVPVFVALSRLYEGAHHLTDVATSAVYAGVWLAVVVRLLQPVPRSAGALRDAPVPHR